MTIFHSIAFTTVKCSRQLITVWAKAQAIGLIMSKITKKDLQHQINRLYAADSTRHNQMLRMQRALSSLGVDIMSDDFDAPSEPKLKQLDQSIFDGQDEEWRFAAIVADGRALYFNKKPCGSDDITGHFVFKGDYEASFCGTGYDTSNWRKSLIERESELTGGDLCQVMYGRGDKLIMCVVSNSHQPQGSVTKQDCIDIIHDLGSFVSSTHPYIGFKGNYKYVAPINSIGEILTAKEAGL